MVVGVDGDVGFGEVAGVAGGGGVAEVAGEEDFDLGGVEGFGDSGGVEGGGGAISEDGGALDFEGAYGGVEACGGLSGGADDSSPVGVVAIHGAFDERGVGDGACDEVGVGRGGGLLDGDDDDLGSAFAIGGDLVGEGLADIVECGGEGFGGGGVVDAEVGASGGEDGGGVVGAGLVIDGDGIEGAVDGLLEEFAEEWDGDLDIGGEVGEHGGMWDGESWSDHAGAFADAGDDSGGLADFEA